MDVDFSGAFTIASDPGTDGGSVATSYSLVASVSDGNAVIFSDSPATSGGAAVVWKEVTAGSEYAGVIDLGGPGEAEVFSLSVNATTGVVTFSQSGVLDHAAPATDNPYTTDILTLDDGQVSIQQSATVTDGDIDTAVDSDLVDLGGNFAIGDDGPSVDVAVDDDDTIMLTTADGATTGGNFTPAGVGATASADFSGSFTAVADAAANSLYGADDTDAAPRDLSFAYELVIDAAGGDSGLTSGGTAIILDFDGTDVVGSAGSTEVFRVSVDDTGSVTLVQSEEIDHPAPGVSSNYTDQILALSTGVLSLKATATVTDFDTDTATDSGTLDLGGNLKFADDGPSVDVDVVDDDTIMLTTADGATPGGNFTPAGVGATASVDFSGSFTAVADAAANTLYGADDTDAAPRDLSFVYELVIDITDGDSGSDLGRGCHHPGLRRRYPGGNRLCQWHGSLPRFRKRNWECHPASVRGNRPSLARRLSSNYTDQILALSTGVLSLKATATVTDFDSDTATDFGTLDLGDNLKFADDGPSVDVNVIDSGIMLTTADGATPDGNFTPTGVTNTASADFSGEFTAVADAAANTLYGADDTDAVPS